jgi:hypothetical protein
MFSGSRNSIVLSGKIDVETGSEKFKTAAAKPDVPVVYLSPYTIYQRNSIGYVHVFRVERVSGAIRK